MVKRHAVRKLGNASRRDDVEAETVAELAMAIALLRGIEPHTEAEFGEMGQRILAKAEKIAISICTLALLCPRRSQDSNVSRGMRNPSSRSSFQCDERIQARQGRHRNSVAVKGAASRTLKITLLPFG